MIESYHQRSLGQRNKSTGFAQLHAPGGLPDGKCNQPLQIPAKRKLYLNPSPIPEMMEKGVYI
jgi:hypothetical protein